MKMLTCSFVLGLLNGCGRLEYIPIGMNILL